MKKVLLPILLLHFAFMSYSQYGGQPYEEVQKLKNYTLLVRTDMFGPDHVKDVKAAVTKYWHFTKYVFANDGNEQKALENDTALYCKIRMDVMNDRFAYYYGISKDGEGPFRDCANFLIERHYHSGKGKVVTNDLLASYLPLALKVMQNYLKLVDEKKISGKKFKDIQKSCEAYYNSLTPQIKDRRLLICSMESDIGSQEKFSEKIKEKYPYKSEVITFEELTKATSGQTDNEKDNDLIILNAGHYLTIFDAKDGTVYYSRDNAPLAYINNPVMKFVVQAIDGTLK